MSASTAPDTSVSPSPYTALIRASSRLPDTGFAVNRNPADLGGDDLLDDHGEFDRVGGQVVQPPVDQGPRRVGGRPAFLDLLRDGLGPGDVQVRLVLPGERQVRQVLVGPGGPYGHRSPPAAA